MQYSTCKQCKWCPIPEKPRFPLALPAAFFKPASRASVYTPLPFLVEDSAPNPPRTAPVPALAARFCETLRELKLSAPCMKGRKSNRFVFIIQAPACSYVEILKAKNGGGSQIVLPRQNCL